MDGLVLINETIRLPSHIPHPSCPLITPSLLMLPSARIVFLPKNRGSQVWRKIYNSGTIYKIGIKRYLFRELQLMIFEDYIFNFVTNETEYYNFFAAETGIAVSMLTFEQIMCFK